MKSLTEKEAEDFLEKNKFSVATRTSVKSMKELENIKIPFPWVMKISSAKIMHKVKIGGVILNIDSLGKAKESFYRLSKISGFKQVIIQEMLSGQEIIIGIKKTPEFSHVLMFGKGGSKVEQEKDVAFRITPLEEKDLNEIIQEIKFFNKIKNKINLNMLKDILKSLQASNIDKHCCRGPPFFYNFENNLQKVHHKQIHCRFLYH
jgi:4-hydroxybutyryl-CoA synthetase (ADP-forming)